MKMDFFEQLAAGDDAVNPDDLQQAAVAAAPDTNKLRTCSQLGVEYLKRQTALQLAEKEVEDAQAAFDLIAKRELPAALADAKLSEFKLEDGTMFGVEEEVYTSISKENAQAAHEWLRANTYGGIIKNKFEISLGKGEDGVAAELQKLLVEKKIPFTIGESVHHSTLKSFVTARLKEKIELPKCFSVFQDKVAKVTKGAK